MELLPEQIRPLRKELHLAPNGAREDVDARTAGVAGPTFGYSGGQHPPASAKVILSAPGRCGKYRFQRPAAEERGLDLALVPLSERTSFWSPWSPHFAKALV